MSVPLAGLDETFYDAFYHVRAAEDRTTATGDVVIVAVDDGSLADLAKNHKYWPWPRDFWAILIEHMKRCGARAVAFDLLFTEPSALQPFMDDDTHFAEALDHALLPVVLATMATEHGAPGPFGPPVTRPPIWGAVNILTDKVVRSYVPNVNGMPSLATRVVTAAGQPLPDFARSPFLLHYYGPHVRRDGGHTYPFLSAAHVFKDAGLTRKGKLNLFEIPPDTFRDKIVLIGAISVGTYDLKASPLSPLYPGVEVQATAIDNLLHGQRVIPVSSFGVAMASLVAALVGALGIALPRHVSFKLTGAAMAAALLVGAALFLFARPQVRWLPMSTPLLALLLATVGAFAWSYLAEDRRRRVVLRALGQYVSPDVANEIQRHPERLKLGGERREMSVMFTDIAGFTDLSESMPSEKLSAMLNFYLGEMSSLILEQNGTIDKYIGDAIMSFWNAPLLQPDHAIRACQAALAMQAREAAIQPMLAEMGAPGLLTRIGINTGQMVFGNMGSAQKFNYTVLGDSVNLGSRLEGANKLYGSRILIAQSTADIVRDRFILRKLDDLRVKGKKQPMGVYELISEGTIGNVIDKTRRRIAMYEEAFVGYQAQRWDAAEATLLAAQQEWPEDFPIAALLKRVRKLRINPPVLNWDGVYTAKDK